MHVILLLRVPQNNYDILINKSYCLQLGFNATKLFFMPIFVVSPPVIDCSILALEAEKCELVEHIVTVSLVSTFFCNAYMWLQYF